VGSLPVDRPSPPLFHLSLIFNFKVNKNTFFEKAKYDFLYMSVMMNGSSVVNDKKDIEQ